MQPERHEAAVEGLDRYTVDSRAPSRANFANLTSNYSKRVMVEGKGFDPPGSRNANDLAVSSLDQAARDGARITSEVELEADVAI